MATVLAAFMLGLGLGSFLGGRLADRLAAPAKVAAVIELTLAVAGPLWSIGLLRLPALAAAILPEAGDATRPAFLIGRLLTAVIVLALPTTLIGAGFPLLARAAARSVPELHHGIGRLVAGATLGGVAGVIATGFVVLPRAGVPGAAAFAAAANLGAALAALSAQRAIFGRQERRDATPAPPLELDRTAIALLAAAAVSGGLVLAAVAARGRRRSLAVVATVAAALLAIGALTAPRFAAVSLRSLAGDPEAQILAYRESPSGTVVVTEDRGTGVRSMYVDNNAVIGSTYDALKVVRMLGLVPALLHPRPDRVLVIGYGAGVTTATIAAAPGVQQIEVAEIVPEVIEAAGFFEPLNHAVLRDPRVLLVANDGRNHLLLGGTPYDVITCDPVHPLFGSAPLYSLDYFDLCRRRLRPGGVVCQYLPLHRMPAREFRRAIATFQAAFAETWVLFGLGHAMLAGSDRPLDLDWERWQRVLEGHGWPDDLADSALATPAQIAALLQLDPEACRRLSLGPPSTDLQPRLEFLAPAAYREGLWEANARLLVDGYQSPLGRIRGLPPSLTEAVRSLVAGKRLLLFSLLERSAGNADGSRRWLSLALQVAGDDPEIQHYARQVNAELAGDR